MVLPPTVATHFGVSRIELPLATHAAETTVSALSYTDSAPDPKLTVNVPKFPPPLDVVPQENDPGDPDV
jgi:hypothetical protein